MGLEFTDRDVYRANSPYGWGIGGFTYNVKHVLGALIQILPALGILTRGNSWVSESTPP